VVTLHNGATVSAYPFILFDLDHDGLSVTVEVDQGPGDVPDTGTLTPPLGFMAASPSVVMDEDTGAVIRIEPIPMG
jgi:hypothetical protein